MLFDCLGIGVGLWASVAATWKPDGQYTFGYSRVETLSGFANGEYPSPLPHSHAGCFLILISIFIIFEALQRVLDPPEMETQQLLLVSSIGLAINLFGMWATGGHHHHGHSHSHGHDHDHGHGHSHGHSHAHAHGHGHGHEHTNGNGHGHGHGIVHDKKVDHRYGVPLEHGHEHGHENGHAHEHAHGEHCEHSHSHEHGHAHGDSHSHAHGNGHGHSHTHDHSHSPSHGHSHGHGHAHSHSLDSTHSTHSAHSDTHDHEHVMAHSHNMRGVFLHVMADTLGSVGVILSTVLIRWTGWTGFDPLASLFIAAMILVSVFPLVLDAARVLVLDVGPNLEPTLRSALTDVASVSGVKSYSAARVWPREGVDLVGSLHVQLVQGADPSKVGAKVESIMRKRVPGLSELVVQLEGAERFCSCMTS